MKKLLFKYTANKPCRLIDIDGKPYLERYYLGCILGWTFYLHRFVSGDGDRSLHDHPWRMALSFVLSGAYTEARLIELDTSERIGMRIKFGTVRFFNIIKGNDFHQIMKAKPDTWTLFVHSPRCKGWGFLSTTKNSTMVGETSSIKYDQPFDPLSSLNWHLKAKLGKDEAREPVA